MHFRVTDLTIQLFGLICSQFAYHYSNYYYYYTVYSGYVVGDIRGRHEHACC